MIIHPDSPQMKTWHKRIAYWITKAADTHSEYVILIAFPHSVRYIASLVTFLEQNALNNLCYVTRCNLYMEFNFYKVSKLCP
jgi:hypothetical protein